MGEFLFGPCEIAGGVAVQKGNFEQHLKKVVRAGWKNLPLLYEVKVKFPQGSWEVARKRNNGAKGLSVGSGGVILLIISLLML